MSLNRNKITSYINESVSGPENSLQNSGQDRAWAEPLIGFSAASDPLYELFKKDIGAFYWTPAEIYTLNFPNESVHPGELTVISWVLPQTIATKRDQRRQRKYASESWARSRNFGEEANLSVARNLIAMLAQSGRGAVAPVLHPAWKWQSSERYGFASNWSERHAAYVSGLGTFGLCDGLITEKGKAMRCGSVVARISLPATPRRYENYRAYCLYYVKGTCKKCVSRCPAGAIDENGHNKEACKEYLFSVTAVYAQRHYGFSSYGCGLCQTAVPCESGIPPGCL